MSVRKIKLTSSEGTEFVVDADVANQSVIMRNMLENCEAHDAVIPLPDVTTPILAKVIEYCTHHRTGAPIPTDDANSVPKKTDNIGKWDTEFCQMDQETLFDLILAADHLDIKPLLDLACATVANMIHNKSPEEIRQTFNILNDFSLAEISKDNERMEQK
ncbi:putative negative regulator sulfur controller-3 [Jimgerdemannia flammicorona]|uniref:E3 ubiquitin ligase complex SCF subunit n=2 Tax=Jimgerdemannia flammicorona TaxID=994334 RepID=A0A433QBF5_9FUNG|nr:putative negative regulator sulfur controller-3 [Jimgerdemannia flammicorona]RUS27105.1 putative negative regulator sulfur controller-3 [Jimgerdemannia flammicorona]